MKVWATTGCDRKRPVRQQKHSNIKDVTGGHASYRNNAGSVKTV